MLTRRHIRVKVLQSLYAFENQENSDLKTQQKFLIESMLNMHDLYLLMLQLPIVIREQAISYMEKSKNKFLATSLEKSPSINFVENKVLLQLENNSILKNLIANRKLNHWAFDNEYPKVLFKELRKSEKYSKYLELKQTTYAQDKEFVLFLFKEIIAPNEKLYEYLEDKKITWIDDYPIVNTAIVRLLESLSPATAPSACVPDLFKNTDDKDFSISLLEKTIGNDEFLSAEIEGRTPNWDKERIAELDLMLIKMGIIEFLHFPTIPTRVTINEYIEIAKEYSTPKSSLFINGVMDKLVKEYSSKGMLNKSGRGIK